jgi:hypothetical protein
MQKFFEWTEMKLDIIWYFTPTQVHHIGLPETGVGSTT